MDRRVFLKDGALALALVSAIKPVFGQKQTLSIGVLPNVSARVIATQYEPLQNHFNQKLDKTVALSTAPDWASFYRNAKAEQYDIVVAAAHVGRLMQVDLGFRPIASYQPNIKGLFVTSKLNTEPLAKWIKGSKIAVANPASLLAFESDRWLDQQGFKVDSDYRLAHVRGDDSVGLSILRGDTVAGILSMGELNSHPAALKEQLMIAQIFAEVPSFLVLASKRLTDVAGSGLGKQLAEFSANSAEGRQFEDRTGFRIISQINDKDLKSMDAFVDKTRRLVA
jgi:phosphonate transport system substrate-binding protein